MAAEWNNNYTSIVTFGEDSIQQRSCQPYYHGWDNSNRRAVSLTNRSSPRGDYGGGSTNENQQATIRTSTNTINGVRENSNGGIKLRTQQLWKRLRGHVRNPQLYDRKRLESRSSTVGTQESYANSSIQSSPGAAMTYQYDVDANVTSTSGLITKSYASTFDSPYTRKALAKSKSMASPNIGARSIITSSYVSTFDSPYTRAALSKSAVP